MVPDWSVLHPPPAASLARPRVTAAVGAMASGRDVTPGMRMEALLLDIRVPDWVEGPLRRTTKVDPTVSSSRVATLVLGVGLVVTALVGSSTTVMLVPSFVPSDAVLILAAREEKAEVGGRWATDRLAKPFTAGARTPEKGVGGGGGEVGG